MYRLMVSFLSEFEILNFLKKWNLFLEIAEEANNDAEIARLEEEIRPKKNQIASEL